MKEARADPLTGIITGQKNSHIPTTGAAIFFVVRHRGLSIADAQHSLYDF